MGVCQFCKFAIFLRTSVHPTYLHYYQHHDQDFNEYMSTDLTVKLICSLFYSLIEIIGLFGVSALTLPGPNAPLLIHRSI